MSNINKEYIESYIREVIPQNKGLLKEFEDYAKEHHVPIIHPEVAQFLRVLIKMNNAKKVLEIGTAIGYSALIMVKSMGQDSKVVTIERRDDMIELAKTNIERAGFSKNITILKGEAKDILPQVNDAFDFVFLDAAKGKYMEFLPYCIENLAPGGVLVSDNVLFKGMVASDELVIRRKKTIVKRMRDYLDYISHHDVLETCIIPIGDGVALSYKKEVQS